MTVIRDGAYVGTAQAKDTPISTIISMMVGRELEQVPVDIPVLSAAPMALEVKHLNPGRLVRDVSFALKQGGILGFAGLMGAGRTEVARVIFGAVIAGVVLTYVGMPLPVGTIAAVNAAAMVL